MLHCTVVFYFGEPCLIPKPLLSLSLSYIYIYIPHFCFIVLDDHNCNYNYRYTFILAYIYQLFCVSLHYCKKSFIGKKSNKNTKNKYIAIA